MKKIITFLVVVISILEIVGCKSKEPLVEYKYITNEVHDTVKVDSLVEKMMERIVREANPEDSALLSQYGLKLKQGEKAYLILQNNYEKLKAEKEKVKVHDSIIYQDRPYPVYKEKELSKWEKFCCDYGKVMIGATVILILIIALLLYSRIKRP